MVRFEFFPLILIRDPVWQPMIVRGQLTFCRVGPVMSISGPSFFRDYPLRVLYGHRSGVLHQVFFLEILC